MSEPMTFRRYSFCLDLATATKLQQLAAAKAQSMSCVVRGAVLDAHRKALKRGIVTEVEQPAVSRVPMASTAPQT
jgi:predicted transcriptional regulator